MLRLKSFIISLFSISIIVAITSGPIKIDVILFLQTLAVYLIFTFLYSHLNTIFKQGNVTLEYGISYGISFTLFTGPLGAFVYEFISKFYSYFQRKHAGTADEDEFLHTFYNIGAHALNHMIGFYLFRYFAPFIGQGGIGYWSLFIIMIIFLNFLSDIYINVVLFFIGEVKSIKDAVNFIKGRSFTDTLKKAVTNGLLYIFLIEQSWSLLIALFILNYLVSRSFMVKSLSMQHKLERDRYEQMAYTDFLSKVHNRAYMNKVMNEVNNSNENIAIVVTDIDSFKRINDTYNHTVGDHVIQNFAQMLQSYLQKDDYIFRSGGEEFTIFLRNRSYEESIQLLHQIRHDVEKSIVHVEFQSKEVAVNCTASFGLYYYKATGKLNIKKAYTFADDLLIQAKEQGKNKVNFKNGTANSPAPIANGDRTNWG